MYNKNICKFPNKSFSDGLRVSSFVLECDQEIINQQTKLKTHRALLVVAGKGAFTISHRKFEYSAGTLIFGFKNEELACCTEEQTEYMYIDFEGLRADELFGRFYLCSAQRCFSGFEGLVPLWKESLSRAGGNTIDLTSESVLLYTFSRIDNCHPPKRNIVDKMIEHTEKNFVDKSLSLSSLAKELSYNPKYLSHIFKKKTGMGYNEYLTNLRIRYAINLFDMGLDSVKNVSLLSGFSDSLYFSNVFKKTTGISPKEYRLKKHND